MRLDTAWKGMGFRKGTSKASGLGTHAKSSPRRGRYGFVQPNVDVTRPLLTGRFAAFGNPSNPVIKAVLICYLLDRCDDKHAGSIAA